MGDLSRIQLLLKTHCPLFFSFYFFPPSGRDVTKSSGPVPFTLLLIASCAGSFQFPSRRASRAYLLCHVSHIFHIYLRVIIARIIISHFFAAISLSINRAVTRRFTFFCLLFYGVGKDFSFCKDIFKER